MASVNTPTANALYRKYKKEGGTLSFRAWIDREKTKGFQNFTGGVVIPVNKPLTDSLNKTLSSMRGEDRLQNKLSHKYVFGIDRNLLIIAGVTLAVVGGIIIYKHKTQK